jgi:AsmA protein
MPRPIKFILIVIAALLALAVAGAAMFAATFNPNDYKSQIIRLAQEKTQRTLAIPGDIKLSFFPKLGVDLGRVSLSERNSKTEFAAVDHARVALALAPLLSRRFVVDHVDIDGLRAHIVHDKSGANNYDDLLSKEEGKPGKESEKRGSGPVAFDIDSVRITNGNLAYEDRQTGRTLALSQLEAQTGRLADGADSKLQAHANIKSNTPPAELRLALKTGFRLELGTKRYTFKDMDLRLDGAAMGVQDLALELTGNADLRPAAQQVALDRIKLAATGKQAGKPLQLKLDLPQFTVTDTRVQASQLTGDMYVTLGTRTISASFKAPAFDGSPQDFTLPAVNIDAGVKDVQLDAKANISGALAGDLKQQLFTSPQLKVALSGSRNGTALHGALTTPFALNLKRQVVDLSNIVADFTLPNPRGGTLALQAAGKASADLGKHAATATLKGKLDESSFNARLGLASFSPMVYNADLGIDRIDLDRYLAPAPPANAPAGPKSNAPAQGKASEKPLDLSALRELHADAKVRIGALKVKNLRTANVRFDLHAAGGKLDVNPLTANLYGGTVNGILSATASRPARFSLKQNLTNIDVGPLLKDATGKNPLEGRGNVQLDVSTVGDTITQLRRGLDGTARLALRDGAVHGVNIAQAVRNAKAKIGELRGEAAPQSGTASAGEKTDFSELNASFRIANGIAHNDDLNIKSPLLRIGGAGDINLADERLDYLVRATVVTTLQGQGGPELQALRGLTVPVKLSGPFTALGWRIDFTGMARELAQQKIDEKKEQVRAQAQKAIEEQKGKVQEQLQDKLKGLLGR